MAVRWTSAAERHYDSYLAYLDESAPGMAAQARADVDRVVTLLTVFPQAGKPARWEGLREVLLRRWHKIMVHRIVGRDLEIVAFYDARQDLVAVEPGEE